jgi:hypothetical protein
VERSVRYYMSIKSEKDEQQGTKHILDEKSILIFHLIYHLTEQESIFLF